MQIKLQNILTEVGVVATLGIGYILLKNKSVNTSNEYEQYIYLNKTILPSVLNKFKTFEDPQFEILLDNIEVFLRIIECIKEKKGFIGAQFYANRLSENICRCAKNMCICARRSKDMDVVISAIDCEEDELKMLTSFCENELRNSLLDM